MQLWHHATDVRRIPTGPDGAWWLELEMRISPIEPGQRLWVDFNRMWPDGSRSCGFGRVVWSHNDGATSHWRARLGPFAPQDRVEYFLVAESSHSQVSTGLFQAAAATDFERV